MVLNRLFASLCGAALLCASATMASERRADEYFGLDLSKAVMSPNPLGPPTVFEHVPVEAEGERTSEPRGTREEPKAEPKSVATEKTTVPHQVSKAGSLRPKNAARVHLAHRHRNPLDAQAFDTRIQTWPCKSGGICGWKQ